MANFPSLPKPLLVVMDFYDFLELRPGRLALVLADVAGKGVSGALPIPHRPGKMVGRATHRW